MKLKDMDESLAIELTDPEFASSYLKYALDDNGVEGFVLALRNVILANQGMGRIAAETELGRESLYKTFSESGNPQFITVYKVLCALGLQISILPIDSSDKSQKDWVTSEN